jgi:dipeptidyl aminopeptidase/acylaminoacyl peptidase
MQTVQEIESKRDAEQRNFEPKDVLNQVLISTLAVAPDASSIVYVQRTVEDGKYARRLWRTTFEGGKPEQLTSAKASDSRPRFSPDGREIVFISDRTGKPQAWVMSLSGGEPRQVTDMPNGIGAVDWSPDGTQLLLLAGSGEKRFLVGKEDDPTARRIRDYTWRLDGAGIRDEFTSVWITDLVGGKPSRLTAPNYNVECAVWSPDGKHVAFAADMGANAGLEEIASVWTLPVEGKAEPRHIASPKSGVFNLAWAPAKHIAFLCVDKPGMPGWADVELHISDGDKTRRLAADRHLNIQVTSYGDYQDVENFGAPPVIWEDEENVLALVAHRGHSHPFRFGVDGTVEALAEPEALCSALAAGGGRVAVVASTDEPSDAYAVENGELRKLTDSGSSWFGPFNRVPERLSIKHPDGHDIDGWMMTANKNRTKAPLVIDVHGGPYASFGPTPWLEMNALADAGFHVIWSNPRGSTSYGEEYARSLDGRWGDPDGSDLLTIIDWAVNEGLADRKKVGIMGLSYGGFMTTWMLANHPGVFKAAVSENPVTDLLGEWATSDFGRFIGRRAIEVQNPWENMDAFLARSPATRMHQNHAPLLLLQAENDMRCPPGNSEMVFNILRTLGREVEMIRYPAESHVMMAIGRPDRRVDRLERIVGWFQKHLAEL